jgi:DNA-binding Lrp family transcriptional regulator
MASAGEAVQATGFWTNDRDYGLQVRAEFLRVSAPSTIEGIEKYLRSGMIRGIGPVYARKLVSAFGAAADEFIRRFLLHALPRGFHRIRHYGLLAGATRKAQLERARQLLAVTPPPAEIALTEALSTLPPCPCCGGQMVIIEIVPRRYQSRAPPPLAVRTFASVSMDRPPEIPRFSIVDTSFWSFRITG